MKRILYVPPSPYPPPEIIPTFLPNYPQFDSDDEREALSAHQALSKKITSQNIKKAQKNHARLPRTAGLRTLSQLSTELTKAGLDPSRIQARAEMLAKIQGAKRKRQNAEDEDDDGDVDVDMEGGEGGEDAWEDDGMDVDGDDTPKRKKAKRSDGAVAVGPVGGRGPRTDRRLAGMRDEGVSVLCRRLWSGIEFYWVFYSSKQIVLSSYAILGSGPAICWPRLERQIVISEQKWWAVLNLIPNVHLIFLS